MATNQLQGCKFRLPVHNVLVYFLLVLSLLRVTEQRSCAASFKASECFFLENKTVSLARNSRSRFINDVANLVNCRSFSHQESALVEWNTILLTPVNRWLYDCLFLPAAEDKLRPGDVRSRFLRPKSTHFCSSVYCPSSSLFSFSCRSSWQVYIPNWEELAVKLTCQSSF